MTKAAVLRELQRAEAASFVIDDFVYFSEEEWLAGPATILEGIHDALLGPLLAVRSSADSESLAQTSPPGAFHSELYVPSRDTAAVTCAVEKVLWSIDRTLTAERGVIVQTQVSEVTLAGVATTLDLNRVPYVTVEYDESGRTDRVTSGHPVRRVVICPNDDDASGRWSLLLRALRDIASMFGRLDLVVEFALDKDGVLHVFQAWDRGRMPRIPPRQLQSVIGGVQRQLLSLRRRSPTYLLLSDMADWNPAEMLGSRPGRLDVSLYRGLITDRTWARARAHLGYFPCTGPLLVEVGTQPYVDVRQSFRSLSPAGLSEHAREAYVEACAQRLLDEPSLHDKVEHSILATYWPIQNAEESVSQKTDLMDRTSRCEFSPALRNMTSYLFSRWEEIIRWGNHSSDLLAKWRSAHPLVGIDAEDEPALISRIEQGIRRCRTYGTLPFAAVARLAFIADGIIRELAGIDLVEPSEMPTFWGLVKTPVEQFVLDLANPTISFERITQHYGHLRPHSYNIESPRYGAKPAFLAALRDAQPVAVRLPGQSPGPSRDVAAAVTKYLTSLGVRPTINAADYLAAAMSAREFQKFTFTGLLSDVLEAMAELGSRFGLSRADVRSLTFHELLRMAKAGSRPALRAAVNAVQEKAEHRRWVQYPDFIGPSEALSIVQFIDARPTYITRRVVDAPIWRLDRVPPHPAVLDNHIVAIEAADPGFDWIFTRPIAGLITSYGGSTSHMAIRCHELRVPAAIGCGPSRFQQLESPGRVILDCRHGSIVPVPLQ